MRIIPTLLALGLVVGGAVAPAASAVPEDSNILLSASPAFSGVLQPNQPLLVSGTVTNNSGLPQDVGVASVYLNGSRLATRTALAAWLDSEEGSPTSSVTALASQVIGELAPGQVRSFNLTIPVSEITLASGAPGVYPLSVDLSADGVQLDVARSTLVWESAADQHTVDLSIVAPLIPPAASTGILTAEELEAFTESGGMFDTELTVARTHSLALGVDPRIVASIRLLGTSAPPAVRDWLTRLESLSDNLFSLPYADADLQLQSAAGAKTPLVPSSFPVPESPVPEDPQITPTPSGSPVPAGDTPLAPPDSFTAIDGALTDIAWPSEGALTVDDLDFFAEAGYSRALVSSNALSRVLTSSPNATVAQHQLTVSDATISDLLRQAATANSFAEWSQVMSALTGALSLAASEDSGTTVVATLGRDGSAFGVYLDKTLTALGTHSWISRTSLQSALSVPPVPDKLADHEHDLDRAPLAGTLFTSELATANFATVADDPSLITGPQRLDLLALLSTSWESQLVEWRAAADAFLVANSALRASVHLPESSTVTLLQEKSNLPIAVRNELSIPVTVYVRVQPERAVLHVLDSRVELKIEANSQAKVQIPVQSIANGEVRASVSLSSVTNEPISAPSFLVLNVQAGWETAATVVLAVFVVLMFIAGVWRTVLRRRKAKTREVQDDKVVE